jgi:hypothetical protein
VGPDVSDVLDASIAKTAFARKELQAAEAACTEAINLERAGRIVDALAAWRTIFGPLFPLS